MLEENEGFRVVLTWPRRHYQMVDFAKCYVFVFAKFNGEFGFVEWRTSLGQGHRNLHNPKNKQFFLIPHMIACSRLPGIQKGRGIIG